MYHVVDNDAKAPSNSEKYIIAMSYYEDPNFSAQAN